MENTDGSPVESLNPEKFLLFSWRIEPEPKPKERGFLLPRIGERIPRKGENRFGFEDFASTIGEAQLSVENSAKAVISCFQIPSWYTILAKNFLRL
jgi:hypothetical protein